ncbi:MAG: hypothetical protein QOG79_2309 [Mycobacterium sp.]|jgi:hypothetical protein|nr:hypothetical protein [Mycobacterium sp.]
MLSRCSQDWQETPGYFDKTSEYRESLLSFAAKMLFSGITRRELPRVIQISVVGECQLEAKLRINVGTEGVHQVGFISPCAMPTLSSRFCGSKKITSSDRAFPSRTVQCSEINTV